jgi:sugar O-acyltransferase (sialic acid O-acetyltransferase NeuD family)
MDVVIIGAGGHGKVVLDILRDARKHRVVGFLDADESLAGSKIAGLKVLGPANLLPKRARLQYMQHVTDASLRLCNAIHARSIVSKSAVVGKNVVIAAGAVVCAEAKIGDGAIINTSAVIDHECEIGRAAHTCPTAALAGRVRVGEGAFVGIGAKVIQCLSLGAWSTIGAGAVVTRDVAEATTVVGVPARILVK